MDTTATVTQSTCGAIEHAYCNLQHANSVVQQQDVALTHLSALQAPLLKRADIERDEAVESWLTMESKVLAFR